MTVTIGTENYNLDKLNRLKALYNAGCGTFALDGMVYEKFYAQHVIKYLETELEAVCG